MAAGVVFGTYRFFAIDFGNSVATVFLNKPPMNTLDKELYPELHAVCDELDNRHDVRAIVFASRLPNVFIAGADIKEMTAYRFEEAWIDERITTVHKALNRVEDLRKPTVAVIEGHALGGGCEFALCCDFRFMCRGKPRIGLPEILLGLIPGGGGNYRLARVVGYSKALEIIMLGARMDADQAERMGLVTRACDEGTALEAARHFAAQLAEQAPLAVALAKQVARNCWGQNRDQALQIEKESCLRSVLTADFREGIGAFIEKRKPLWKGQ